MTEPPANPPCLFRLEGFLKYSGLVATGGEAKVRIQAGEISVNGETETRRRRQLFRGDTVTVGDETVVVETD